MTIAGQNFEVYQGDDKQIIIEVRDRDGSLTDLTDYSVIWCVYNFSPYQIILHKTTLPGGGITIPNPLNGQIIIELIGDDTVDLITKIYGHQCEIQGASGNHATVTTGYMSVVRSTTHQFL